MGTERVRVLYVDDDEILVRLISRALAKHGFDVTHATSVETALELIENCGADVIALDHNLPTGTGLDFLKALTGREGLPAVVYVTGSADMDIAVAALKAGASDFVPKTVGDDFLVLLEQALTQAVEKSRLREAKEEAEREVRAARDRAEILLREVNHRVANSLALVSSLIGLQAKAVSDQVARDALAETQGRIFAIAAVHKRLYTSDDVRYVAIDDYLGSLLSHLEDTVHAGGHSGRIIHEISPLQVSPDKAVSIGVVVTELVTNAFKYAYPGSAGDVRVELSGAPGAVTLTVCDDGVGWDGQGKIQGSGLGSRIVAAMAISLDARVRYAKESGTRAIVSFALDAPAEA